MKFRKVKIAIKGIELYIKDGEDDQKVKQYILDLTHRIKNDKNDTMDIFEQIFNPKK